MVPNIFLLKLIASSFCLLLHHRTGWVRSFLADYGVPLMVVLWTALSYSVPGKVPSGVPRRLFSPLPWEPASLHHWTVTKVFRLILPVIILNFFIINLYIVFFNL